MKEGDSEIRITGLSSYIDNQSVRASGLDPAVHLIDISCTVDATNAGKPDSSLRALLQKKAGLEAEKLVRQQETDIYLAYARKISSDSVSTDQFVPFMNTFFRQRSAISQAIANLDEQIHSVEQTIAKVTDRKPSGRTDGEVTVHLFLSPSLLQDPVSSSGQPDEPDEEWKQKIRNEIEAQLAPDIGVLQQALANKLSVGNIGTERGQAQEEHDQLMQGYISLAQLRFDEQLKLEMERRANRVRSKSGITTSFTLTYSTLIILLCRHFS